MEIKVTKLTDVSLCQKAYNATARKKIEPSLYEAYKTEHSPIRTQKFCVEMIAIPTFVSVHFVRHKIGVEHFVQSNREDRGGDKQANRFTPITHMMLCNAESLITMARKRLCTKAHTDTRKVMELIKEEVKRLDTDLNLFLVPNCIYRGGICPEPFPCHLRWQVSKEYSYYKSIFKS